MTPVTRTRATEKGMSDATRALFSTAFSVTSSNGWLTVTIRHDSFRGYGVTGLDSTAWHLSPELAGRVAAGIAEVLKGGEVAQTYEEWANGGGPNECEHGIAAGLHCTPCKGRKAE